MTSAVGIAALAYVLPKKTVTVEELAREGKLISPAATLRSFGFDRICIARKETAYDLAKQAAGQLLSDSSVDPRSIDAVLFATAFSDESAADVMDLFLYPVARLQYELGMSNAIALGTGQQGCSTLLSTIRLAAAMIRSDKKIRRVLCVSADVFPSRVHREVIYNIVSDGAAAALVTDDAPHLCILAVENITKGYYWNGNLRRNELIASYFPTAKNIIRTTLSSAGIGLKDVTILVPHNVSRRSWDILLGLLPFPSERFFGENIARFGHCIGADTIMNLHDAVSGKRIKKGAYILLFSFGFGANWSSMLLRY